MDKAFALVISALDPTNGAGFTLDITLLEAMGIKPMGVPTAILPQDPSSVAYIKEIDESVLMDSLESIFSIITPDGMKVSIMGNLMEKIPEICPLINGPKVLDPIISPGGLKIIEREKLNTLRKLIPCFDFITPNIPEAMEILGIKDLPPEKLCEKMFHNFGVSTYLKGGHSTSKIDYFCTKSGIAEIPPSRKFPYEVHGTGCFFSTALLGFLINGDPPKEAILKARNLLERAYEAALDVGKKKRIFPYLKKYLSL